MKGVQLQSLNSGDGEGYMERVLGIGGIFFRARDPQLLASWYREHLGVPLESGQTYGAFESDGTGEKTVWSTFPADTAYFGAGATPFMVNYRVRNLEAILAQLRAAGAKVEDRVEEYENGRFGWASDPEGNRFELWEPRLSRPAETTTAPRSGRWLVADRRPSKLVAVARNWPKLAKQWLCPPRLNPPSRGGRLSPLGSSSR